MISDDELRTYIVNGFEPDDLVNTLGIGIDDLVNVLWDVIHDNMDKLYFIDTTEETDDE